MRILLLCSIALLLTAGCSDDSGDENDTNNVNNTNDVNNTNNTNNTNAEDPDSGVDADEQDAESDPDTQVEPDVGEAPQVTSAHSGWKDPDCAGCHDGDTAANPHGSDYEVPACVECHGYNGASHTGHAGSGNCSSCHGADKHELGFSSEDCSTCHFHP